MGQKINPHGLRVGIIKDWDSRWYADNTDYSESLNNTEGRELKIGKVKYWDSVTKQKIKCQNQKIYKINKRLISHKRILVA